METVQRPETSALDTPLEGVNQRYLGLRAMFIVRQAILDRLREPRHNIAISDIKRLSAKDDLAFYLEVLAEPRFFKVFPESRYALLVITPLFKFISLLKVNLI